MIYTHGIVAILAAIGVWFVQDWRFGGKIAVIKLDWEKAKVLAVEKARNEESGFRKGVEDALRESRKREIAQASNARGAIAERDRLRAQLTTNSLQLSAASCGSVRQYTSTLSGLFDQCIGRYQELAAKASGHASDTRTLIEAWPKP